MDYVEIARKLRALLIEKAEEFSDEEALEFPFAYPKWSPDKQYSIGERVRYGEHIYKVLQNHYSQSDWKPDTAVSLFARILPGQDGSLEDIGDWVQPDSTNAYMTGDRVRFEGTIYASLIDNNVWSPAAYPAGWQEVK